MSDNHFERRMDVGKKGFCLVPGHPVEHVLDTECWGKLCAWLHDRPGTEQQYKNDCRNK